MRKIALFVVGALSVLACSKKQPEKVGTTNLTGATVSVAPTADDIRLTLKQAKPNDPEVDAFVITDEGGMVTIRGMVPDEKTHDDMVRRIKAMSKVTGVNDELRVPSPTPTTDAVRTSMTRDEPSAATVVQHLIISDDGSAILIQGVVPDEATHDALLDSARKAASGEGENVKDEMHVSGK